MSAQKPLMSAAESQRAEIENSGRQSYKTYLKRCLDGVSLFLSKWPTEIRQAKEAADAIWRFLPEIEVIRPLKIAYYVFNNEREGIYQKVKDQVVFLKEKGHDVTVLYRFRKPQFVDEISWEKAIQIPPDSNLADVLPGVEVVVGTSWMTMWDLMLCKQAEPVLVEVEEETFNLFDDPMAFGNMMELPIPIACLSEHVKNTLLLYGRDSTLTSCNDKLEKIFSLFGRMHRVSQVKA